MFEILDKVCTPTKGTEFSACVDLYAREDVVIGVGETVLVPLGVKIDFQKLKHLAFEENINYGIYQDLCDSEKIEWFLKSHQLNLHIRSSMSAKHGLIIANGTGIIDLDYDGEVMICLHNPVRYAEILNEADAEVEDTEVKLRDKSGNAYKKIKKGQPIAQISLVEHKSYLFGVESEEKRNGGFGSTDKLSIDEFRKRFIKHMNNRSNCGLKHATFEFEAIKNDIDLSIDTDPEYYADECMSVWAH